MNELIELVQILIYDESRMICQLAGQIAWIIFPITLKWKTDKLVTHGYTKARLEMICGNY